MVVGAVVGVLCLAACGSQTTDTAVDPPADPTSAATPDPTPDPTSEPATAAEPPFPRGAKDQYQEQSGEWDLVLTGVEVAAHEGFDRVVMEFSGTGVPGWSAGYVDQPVFDGSGDTVTLAGDTYLDSYASGTTWPADDYYSGPHRLTTGGSGPVSEVFVVGTFEGYTQVLIGVEGTPAPYRIFPLTDPARLVIDVSAG